MNLFNFGKEQLENGSLNGMLEQVGIDDVGSFVNQFRKRAKKEAKRNDEDFDGESDQTAGAPSGADMFQGAMKAYEAFSGGQGNSGDGNFLNNMGSTVQNAQKMYALYKQFDKNGDGKVTVEDVQIYLQELGLGGASSYLAQGIFQAVDQNHNGTLDFTDLMALTAMLNKLYGQYGNVA